MVTSLFQNVRNLSLRGAWALVVLAVGAVGGPAVAQPLALTKQSPFPVGIDLGGVAFATPSRCFIVGDNHHLLESNNGGATFLPRMTDELSTDPFYTITFASPTHGYLAGNNQDAFRTTDGGATWTRMTTFPFGSARVLDFITPTVGFAGFNGAIAATVDGGVTWTVPSGFPGAPIVYGMDFRDTLVGVAGGGRVTPHNDSGIYRTADGGATWTLVHGQACNDVFWIDSMSALAVSGADVLRSDDEGLTWYPVSIGGLPDGLSNFARVGNTSTVCGVSGKGSIWRSGDMGFSWTQVAPGLGVFPANWDIAFGDEFNGCVVGASGITWRTSDGGSTWTLSNSGVGDQIMDLEFYDDQFGVAVTNFGYVMVTHNGGAQWDINLLQVTGQVFGRSEGLASVSIVDSQFVVVAGAGGVVFMSYDGGLSWSSMGYPNMINGGEALTNVKFLDRFQGFVSGFGGTYWTNDGGFSWTLREDLGGAAAGMDAKGDNVWMAPGGRTIWRSINRGATFTQHTLPQVDTAVIEDISFADPNNGWVVARYGYIARSTNAGLTWTPQWQPETESFLDVSAVSASEAWTIGFDNNTNWSLFAKHTTDGGRTWTRHNIQLGYAEVLSDVHAMPNGRVYFGGNFGRIMASQPQPIRVLLPGGAPSSMEPGVNVELPVTIVASSDPIEPASPTLHLRRSASGPFTAYPLRDNGDGTYAAVFPPLNCGDAPQYYLSAATTGGASARFPTNAPASLLSAAVGTFNPNGVLLEEAFDSGLLPAGWTASGLWHVGTACPPPGTCGSGARAYFGQDSTCTFETGARVAGMLVSPPLTLPQLEPGQNITMTYCHALATQNPENGLSENDKAIVWASASTGRAPLDLATDSSAWRTRGSGSLNFQAGRTVRLQFEFDSVTSAGNNHRGWHVDNIRVTGPKIECAQPCRGDLDNGSLTGTRDGAVNIDDLIFFLGAFEAGASGADIEGPGGAPDGAVTVDDLLFFLMRFEAGC